MFFKTTSILSALIIIIRLLEQSVWCRTLSDTMNAHISELSNLKPLDIPVECHNTKYCSIKPKNYPDELINKIFNNKHMKLLFTSECLTNETPVLWGNDDCEKTDLNITIYTIPNDNSLIVINTKEFPQIKKGQLCERTTELYGYQEDDMKCFKDLESPPYSETYCRQMYTSVKLLALSTITKSLQYIHVTDFPISCSCYYKTKFIDYSNYF